SINSAALKDPNLLVEAANQFGSQCIVLAIDAKCVGDRWIAFSNGGRVETDNDAVEWAVRGADHGAGEILLTSMDADGTRQGFDLSLTRAVSEAVSIPVIASGGAGEPTDFVEVFTIGKADAALAASIFHFREIEIPKLKDHLKGKHIEVRI